MITVYTLKRKYTCNDAFKAFRLIKLLRTKGYIVWWSCYDNEDAEYLWEKGC